MLLMRSTVALRLGAHILETIANYTISGVPHSDIQPTSLSLFCKHNHHSRIATRKYSK